MDDLDHSMCIAEYDWMSFYEESEECVLLQPSLACPDSSNLSDSDDSGNSSSGQRLQISENRDPVKSSAAAGCCMEGENYTHCVKNTSQQINQSYSGEQDVATTKAEMLLDHGERTSINTTEHITEESDDIIMTTLQTKQLNVQSDGELSERKIEEGNVQMQSDIHDFISTQKCGPLSELDVNELQSTDRVASEDASGVALRAEKERWFVTVNDSPAQEKLRSTAVKKKRRQKKTCKDNHVCKSGEERSLKHRFKLEITKGNNIQDEVTVTENVNQANYILMEKPDCQSTKEDAKSIQRQVTSDSSQMSGEEVNLSEKLVTSQFPIDDTTETTTDSSSHDTLPLNTLDSAESDELDDAVEFFSIHSFDSESYLSAAESVEELQHLVVEHHPLQSSLSLRVNSRLFQVTCEDAEAGDIQDGAAHSCDGALFGNSAKSEGHKHTNVQPTLTFPSALTKSQSFTKMPGDCDSACDNDKQSLLPSDMRGSRKHNDSASGCSSGEHLLHVPDLTVTPAADSPETYGEVTGCARPVYAISAFWDEMEKLTINDILQLRMGRNSPPRETQEATPNVDDDSSLVDTVDYILSDSSQMDTSDTADSGYFTQPDESKPDRSSCEFSTSDFEEEYRQCFGTSRNPSPEPQSQKQSVSLIFAHKEESTSTEEKETLPSEDFARKCFEDQESNSFISSKLAWPRQITKSKSVQNIQALNTEDFSLQFLLGDSKISPCLEESMILKSSSLGTLMPSPFVDEQLKISFPDMFHYFFKEDKANSDSLCVTVCEPEDILLVPGFDYTLCTFGEEISLPSLHDSQRSEGKPIPIFSCCHPTVRELTFPNPEYVFLSADCEEDNDLSPIRVLSHSFIQSSGRGAAVPHGFPSWNSLMRKIHFPDKGSIWCRRSGAWMFPCEDPPITAATERRGSATQCFRELAVQQGVLGTIQTTRREDICSTLKQSDMCLVCIAFASWVLKSSDPEAADAWKAVLLANVSALSAIQYLRHYVKKNPS